jgi:3-methyladenine DNA glycosylase AlkC
MMCNMIDFIEKHITSNRVNGVKKFHTEFLSKIQEAKGSSHNHQNWVGG